MHLRYPASVTGTASAPPDAPPPVEPTGLALLVTNYLSAAANDLEARQKGYSCLKEIFLEHTDKLEEGERQHLVAAMNILRSDRPLNPSDLDRLQEIVTILRGNARLGRVGANSGNSLR